MMAVLSKIIADPDSLQDAIGAFGLIGLVFLGCFAGEVAGWWGR